MRVVTSRAEEFTPSPVEQYDYILGRAVSALPNFLGFSSHLIRKKPEDVVEDDKKDGKKDGKEDNEKDGKEDDKKDGKEKGIRSLSNGLLYVKGGDFADEVRTL